MAFQDAFFGRLDDLPDSRVLFSRGLEKSLFFIQGILGRLRNEATPGRYKGLIFVFRCNRAIVILLTPHPAATSPLHLKMAEGYA